MLPRSARILPSSAAQILEPMRSLPLGSMPYSLGMTAFASTLAVCSTVNQMGNRNSSVRAVNVVLAAGGCQEQQLL